MAGKVQEQATFRWAVTARVVITGEVRAATAAEATSKLGEQLRQLRGVADGVNLTVVDVHTARKLQ